MMFLEICAAKTFNKGKKCGYVFAYPLLLSKFLTQISDSKIFRNSYRQLTEEKCVYYCQVTRYFKGQVAETCETGEGLLPEQTSGEREA